jgi:hypothetical protein
MYASRALKDNELTYSTYELEFLAGKFAFNVFHEYIAGGKVDWYTDHSALQAVDRQKKGADPAMVSGPDGDRFQGNLRPR